MENIRRKKDDVVGASTPNGRQQSGEFVASG